jgi:hypothetical protein
MHQRGTGRLIPPIQSSGWLTPATPDQVSTVTGNPVASAIRKMLALKLEGNTKNASGNRHRRGDRLVAAGQVLDPPGFAVHRTIADNGMAGRTRSGPAAAAALSPAFA